jgi:hypothetical protein
MNVVASYLITALVPGTRRQIYLSSDMHAGWSSELSGVDWLGRRPTVSYSTSKLLVTALAMAVARLRPRRRRECGRSGVAADPDGRDWCAGRPDTRSPDAGVACCQ